MLLEDFRGSHQSYVIVIINILLLFVGVLLYLYIK